MKDFRLRTITETSTDGRIEVDKTNRSDDTTEVVIRIDGVTKICVPNDDAEVIRILLVKIVNHPCLLEEGGEEK